MSRLLLVSFALVFFGFAGCGSVMESRIKEEPFTVDKAYKHAGSLQSEQDVGTVWRPGYARNNLFEDQRARGRGDILVIKIVEISQASEKATTDTARSSDLDAGIQHFFGQEVRYPARHSAVNPVHLLTANTKNDFTGSGETTRTGALTATITARVVEVLPNGNLAIEGKREIYVNNEKKEILLQGVVRPRDIGYDNSLLSTQVADAKIIITGIGVIGDKQKPGWLSRVFDKVWPF